MATVAREALTKAGGTRSLPSDIEGFPMKGASDSPDNKEGKRKTEKDEEGPCVPMEIPQRVFSCSSSLFFCGVGGWIVSFKSRLLLRYAPEQ
ncbi:hypothetical protein AVEN_4528-1 [Araneus ventricosus]|uniref:Uncharacterized protein n=1 Tax=Araneus ventricosus TaxID=182803 RepID=A0A4Y2BL69_ARAVE|nr:hypothetical protein AVEN_4528-1 [Araneus ventricosus]